MRKRHHLNLFIWLALLIVAALEFGSSFLPLPVGLRPILLVPAVAMAVLVAVGYMRLRDASDIGRGFAIAGVFWLTVLLGLAMMDPLTRAIDTVTQ